MSVTTTLFRIYHFADRLQGLPLIPEQESLSPTKLGQQPCHVEKFQPVMP